MSIRPPLLKQSLLKKENSTAQFQPGITAVPSQSGILYIIKLRYKEEAIGKRCFYDLEQGTTEYGDRRWQQFEKGDADLVIDLGEAKNVAEVNIGFLVDNNDRIFLPASIAIYVSDDNKNFTQIIDNKYPAAANPQPLSINRMSFNINKEAKYINY